MAIGKIDCTSHKSLCNEFNIRGYPTLKYALDGNIEEYPGNRDEGALISFAKRMSAPAVSSVANYDDAIKFAKTQTEEGVAFLGYDPTSTPKSPSALQQVFLQVARKKQSSAYFLWLEGTGGGESPFVHRIEAEFPPKAWIQKESTTEALTQFVKEQNVPLISTFGPHNLYRIGNKGRPLVISVVDFENEEQTKDIKDQMMDYIAKAKDPDQYYYGIIDGMKFQGFLEQFRVVPEDTPQIIVLEVRTKMFWQNSTYNNIFEFLKAVEDGSVASAVAVKGGYGGLMDKIERAFLDYFPYSFLLLIVIVFGLILILASLADDYDAENASDEQKGEVAQESKKDK